MNPISLIYDVLCVVIAAACIIKGAKNGFVKTAILTVGYIASGIAAVVISSVCTALIYSAAIEPAVVSGIETSLLGAADTESVVEGLTEAVEGLPAISHILFDFEGAAESLIAASGFDAAAIAEAAVENVIRPVVEPIISSLIFIISVIILTSVVSIVAKGSKIVNEVPIIGPVNSFFGGAAGIVSGIIEVFIAAVIISFIISAGISPEYFSEEIIEGTHIFKYFYAIQKSI